MSVRPAIIPNLRYHDARGAIDFLCRAFGFSTHAVHADADNVDLIHHAQLLFHGQMIMLASVAPSDFARAAPLRTVREAGGNTQTLYVTIDDVDAHADIARAAGADIFMAPADNDYGGRGYGARDLEGNVWSFGNYDPFAA